MSYHSILQPRYAAAADFTARELGPLLTESSRGWMPAPLQWDGSMLLQVFQEQLT